MYLSSTAVVVSEIMKIMSCFLFLYKEANNNAKQVFINVKEEITVRWIDSLKLAVPAILYTIQNNLLFLALSSLDAATYQVIIIRTTLSILCLNILMK